MNTQHNFTANKNPGIQTAKLRTIWLSSSTVAIYMDHSPYTLEIEPELAEAIAKAEHGVKSVCSMQTYITGEKIAVCRLHRDSIKDSRNA